MKRNRFSFTFVVLFLMQLIASPAPAFAAPILCQGHRPRWKMTIDGALIRFMAEPNTDIKLQIDEERLTSPLAVIRAHSRKDEASVGIENLDHLVAADRSIRIFCATGADGSAPQVYPFQVQVLIDNQAFLGCCADQGLESLHSSRPRD